MPRALIYCRISRDVGHDELGVRRQEADCRALCERLNLEVAGVFVDDDRSAYSGKARPGYLELLAAVKTMPKVTVVAWHPDRLTRHPRELEDLIDVLETAKATVRTVQSGELDLSTASGRMTARVVGAVARHESEHKSARIRRKHLELAEAGKIAGGGSRPFGYLADKVTIDPIEAAAIRDVAARVLAGHSPRSLARELNERGITTTSGRQWTGNSLKNTLLAPHLAGLRAHHRVVAAVGTWPGIITPEQRHRLLAVLTDPARRVNANARSYLLTGLVFCGLCGHKMVARPDGSKQRCYVCNKGPGFPGCGRMKRRADDVEELVVTVLRARTPVLPAEDVAPLDLSGLDRIESRLAELGEMWASGELDRVGWQAARKRLEAERATFAEQIPRIAPRRIEEWDDCTFDERRVALFAAIDKVVVHPAVKGRNTFDSSKVKIEWRS